MPRFATAAASTRRVRGIGSIYYLAYATSHLELVNEGQLWAMIALTILLSTASFTGSRQARSSITSFGASAADTPGVPGRSDNPNQAVR